MPKLQRRKGLIVEVELNRAMGGTYYWNIRVQVDAANMRNKKPIVDTIKKLDDLMKEEAEWQTKPNGKEAPKAQT